MFFKEDEINCKLVCPKCKEPYEDPRILPCGKTICIHCIEDLLERKSLRCEFCASEHVIPQNGFTKNTFITDLMGVKPHEVYRGAWIEEYKTTLKKFSTSLAELEKQFKSSFSSSPVKEHCQMVRNEIDLVTDTLIDKIQQYRDEFLGKLGNYEKECILNIEKENFFRSGIEKFLAETNKFYESCNNDLKNCDLREHHIKDQMKVANLYLSSMEEKLAPLKVFEMNKERPEFVSNDLSNVFSDILGRLEFHHLGEYMDPNDYPIQNDDLTALPTIEKAEVASEPAP